MKSFLTTLLIVVSLVGFTKAQGNMALGAGVIFSLPMGDWSEGVNMGIGGTAAFEMGFMPNLVGTGQIGYITWSAKDAESNEVASASASISSVPVMFGAKYFFVPGMGLYGAAQLGLYFTSFDAEVEVADEFQGFVPVTDYSASSTDFAFALGGGYEIPVSPTFDVDLSATLVIISEQMNLQFRLGGKMAL